MRNPQSHRREAPVLRREVWRYHRRWTNWMWEDYSYVCTLVSFVFHTDEIIQNFRSTSMKLGGPAQETS